MLTGQNENICHGLQIGKDQKGNNQRDENGYQFNNVGFNEDILIFADTPAQCPWPKFEVEEKCPIIRVSVTLCAR